MQNSLDTYYPEYDIQILGINGAWLEHGNTSITTGRNIPWLQDVDHTGEPNVWTSWDVTYRDVIILDTDNTMVGAFNLTTHDLQKWDDYNALIQIFLDTAMSHKGSLLGDASNDNQVTGRDLIAVQQNFGSVDPNNPTDGLLLGDANDDGLVTGADLISVQQNFGNTLVPVGAEVPEPASVGLLTLVSLGVLAHRRWVVI